MTHGAFISEKRPPGEWIWEFAASRNDGLCVFAPEIYVEFDHSMHRPERPLVWDESLIGPIGQVGTVVPQAYARYQPEWNQPFTQMCDKSIARMETAIATPLDVTDGEALKLLNTLDEAHPIFMRLLLDRRNIRSSLWHLSVGKWVFLMGFAYEDYATFILSEDADLVAAAIRRWEDDKRIVKERW